MLRQCRCYTTPTMSGDNVAGRDQKLQMIINKLKPCAYPTVECSLPRIEGFDYCIRHILRDPRGKYRQCTYSYHNGRKCINAVTKHDIKKDPNLTTLCFEHNRREQLLKTRTRIGKLKLIETNEVLLNYLINHLNVRNGYNNDQEEEIDVVSSNEKCFVSYEQINDIGDIASAVRKRRRILDYASDTSEDEEVISLINTAGGYECYYSDDESADSLDDDVLRHACTYTSQEILRISEAKLTKLQGLYIEQINRLHHLLREKRRRYLRAIRQERDHLCSIYDQHKGTTREQKRYAQLKAFNSYHRRHGVEAVLYKKFKDKRLKNQNYNNNRNPHFIRCIFSDSGVKCLYRPLPSSKYCRKHVLIDKKQVLFKACEREKSSVVCQEPIPNILDDPTCILHLPLPQIRQYTQKKYDSETEDEELIPKIKEEIKSMKKESNNDQTDVFRKPQSCPIRPKRKKKRGTSQTYVKGPKSPTQSKNKIQKTSSKINVERERENSRSQSYIKSENSRNDQCFATRDLLETIAAETNIILKQIKIENSQNEIYAENQYPIENDLFMINNIIGKMCTNVENSSLISTSEIMSDITKLTAKDDNLFNSTCIKNENSKTKEYVNQGHSSDVDGFLIKSHMKIDNSTNRSTIEKLPMEQCKTNDLSYGSRIKIENSPTKTLIETFSTQSRIKTVNPIMKTNNVIGNNIMDKTPIKKIIEIANNHSTPYNNHSNNIITSTQSTIPTLTMIKAEKISP